VHYDGLWVTGLSAEQWPAAPATEAFVPYPVLAAANIAAFSVAGQLQRARAAMSAWQAAADEVVYSWPGMQDDTALAPSHLLPPTLPTQPLAASRWYYLSTGVTTELCGADQALPWRAGPQPARGGSALLQSQAQCPFQAAALWRLQCLPVVAPVPGLTPRVHGEIMHHSLQLIWNELQGSEALAQPVASLQALVRRHVQYAISQQRDQLLAPIADTHWEIEQGRCEQVIAELWPLERARTAFRVLRTEQQLELQAGGLRLRLRCDRVDRVAGDPPYTVLIDYKTGRPGETVDWLAERPAETQLLCYAHAYDQVDGHDAGEELRAVVTLHAHAALAKYRGVADQDNRLPGVKGVAAGSWQILRARWRERIEHFASEFASGQAAVTPLPRACERCHLAVMCRVSANGQQEPS
jgi:hypothetical protein